MALSFTAPTITRLEKEIADIQKLVRESETKRQKALSTINKLQRDQKLSRNANDLSNKITRENKLKKEIEEINGFLKQSSNQLADKNQLLTQLRMKTDATKNPTK
ncbi:hypothetical protein [Paenibacillus sp. YAF4_2]|uniref:hypothetical protein n=1 Tax=Paenibacillus sp. YAF4_2 TaxID=3233085 RepID=UPI003F94D045